MKIIVKHDSELLEYLYEVLDMPKKRIKQYLTHGAIYVGEERVTQYNYPVVAGAKIIIDTNSNVRGPLIVIILSFGAEFKGKRNFGQNTAMGEIGWKVIRDKPSVKPNALGFHSVRQKKAIGIIKSANFFFCSQHSAGCFDMAVGEHSKRHFNNIFRFAADIFFCLFE